MLTMLLPGFKNLIEMVELIDKKLSSPLNGRDGMENMKPRYKAPRSQPIGRDRMINNNNICRCSECFSGKQCTQIIEPCQMRKIQNLIDSCKAANTKLENILPNGFKQVNLLVYIE